ncbi:hypothetical protein [Diaphorobacter caeni]|uniref:hypothetical protein n=1 Tax=Diaphorobacter caeni TaxID=2784387 RepID=UPI00188F9E8F|nr:hypothetical protein [Diaphorobacter caeni]MBF5004089.1 hypothetical protein [Diaphorobacter caeni]
MSPDKAYALFLAWKAFVGPVRKASFTGIEQRPNGSFKAIHGGADFDYDIDTRTLMVMRLLTEGANPLIRDDHPGVVANRKLALQEPFTMGGAQFFINPRPWLTDLHRARSPGMNAYMLRRDFNDADIPKESFVLDVRWLLFWGFYWYPHGGNLVGVEEPGFKRAFRPQDYLERTRPALEKWANALLAKGEPPDL